MIWFFFFVFYFLLVLGLTETLRAQLDQGLPAALQREAEQQAICYAKKDLLEGIAAIKGNKMNKHLMCSFLMI